QCVLPSWCKLAQEGSDPEDTFRRASCMYQRLAMSDEGAMLQSHHQEYGPNLNNFGRDNAIGACVWVSTIVLSLLVTWDMAKTVYADVLACWRLCGRYREKRRGGLAWRDALRAAAQGTLGEASEQEEAAPSGSSVPVTDSFPRPERTRRRWRLGIASPSSNSQGRGPTAYEHPNNSDCCAIPV
ncbi:hypothetical protein MTO96_043749, partial [Rhipicephalus appendiculatus]